MKRRGKKNMITNEINPAPFEIFEEVAELILHNAIEVIGMMGYCQHGPPEENMLSIYPMEEEMTSGKYDGELVYALPHYDLNVITELFPDLIWGRWSTMDNELSFEITYRGYEIFVTLRGSPWEDKALERDEDI